MADLVRAAFVALVVGNVVVVGCAAKVASTDVDGVDGGPGDPATIAVADAAPSIDATVVVEGGTGDASGPRICDPQDTRRCEVATAAEGVACPATFEDAKATFTCAGAPNGSSWLYGRCSTYFIASFGTFNDSTQCFYDLDTHALVGSYGYDDCGAFCGGVNHIHWGVAVMPCGLADSAQGTCSSDAGSDAADGG